ncbi:hypothetical protein GQ43DRAFT_2754 [Delitschia confertaspora ATCC 74209]|uniref:Uncharacterized protein n=1 Tax=Delitschia confertaspora ATCC 74209 TaxID=1513339 RepID=A0A9P4N3T1_9PLEO|nr:hypothetical protein GQ43DRAFT_2754 [Delitschia confertaspora ATCC 74209]
MAATIPLHCNICPKKPNFSDVSHLLTHIASKGHLSYYYKVKVRSGSEEASRKLVESYDRWYAEWNVEELMSERMNQKEKRRTRTRGTGRSNPAPKIEAPLPRSTRSRSSLNTLLDPRLSEQHAMIKVEASVTPTPPPQMDHQTLRLRSFAPRMQLWPTDSRSTSRSYTNPDYETSSEYSDPSDRRVYRYTAQNSCAIEDDPADLPTLTTEDTSTSECTRLKGIYWPGMDIFDSATPEMKRKRNQKKDISVVEQLELNSQEVEPTELIFTPQGSFKKQRRISSSNYDESSPIKLETSPNRPFLQRPVLADIDTNGSRRPRPQIRPPTFPYLPRNAFDDEHGQLEYPYNERRKRTFNVFQDHDVSFTHPAGLNYLTSEYRQPSPAPAFPPYKPYSDPFMYDNKENVQPMYNHQRYEHPEPAGYNYPAYYHGGSHDDPGMYQNPLYNNPYQHHHIEEVDDQRTLTAPPSPSTG